METFHEMEIHKEGEKERKETGEIGNVDDPRIKLETRSVDIGLGRSKLGKIITNRALLLHGRRALQMSGNLKFQRKRNNEMNETMKQRQNQSLISDMLGSNKGMQITSQKITNEIRSGIRKNQKNKK